MATSSASVVAPPTRRERAESTIDRLGPSRLVGVVALLVYLATAQWTGPQHIDPLTHMLAAWSIGTTGSPIMPDHEVLTDPFHRENHPWIVDSPRGPVSQYPPGAALLAAPLSAIWPGEAELAEIRGSTNPDADPVEFPVVPRGPAIIVAVVCAAGAAAVITRLFEVLGASPLHAVAGGLIVAFGTALWGVASQQLWHHGPAALFIAIGLLLTSRDRLWLAGASFGAAILVRPHVAVIAAAVGIAVWSRRRDWSAAAMIGAGSAAGLGALLAYNAWVWGRLTVVGGYSESMGDNLVSSDIVAYARNFALGFVDGDQGLLFVSPVVVLVLIGAPFVFTKAPDWAQGGAIGALVFLAVQYKANRFSGGTGFIGYRYPIEALAAFAPLAFIAWREWISVSTMKARLFTFTAIVSVLPQAVGAILFP